MIKKFAFILAGLCATALDANINQLKENIVNASCINRTTDQMPPMIPISNFHFSGSDNGQNILYQNNQISDPSICLVSKDQIPLQNNTAPQMNVSRIWYGPHIITWQANGLFVQQAARNSNPASAVKSVGAGIAYTYGGFKNITLGSMFDYYRAEQHASSTSGHTNEYIITLYCQYAKNWVAETGFLLLLEDNHFHRHIENPTETAKSSFMQYGLAPHWRFGYRWIYSTGGNRFTVEPFAQLEILTTLQEKYTESDAPIGGNSFPSAVFCSTLTQTGLRLWQLMQWTYGYWIVHQKVAYFNITPFGKTETVIPIFVGEPTAITLNNNVQNLFAGTFSLAHEWKNGCMLSGIYQGIFGDGYSSNMVTGTFSYNF